MDWEEYKKKYENGCITVAIDKSLAMILMDKKNKYVHKMFSGRRKAHYIWLNISLFIMTLGIGSTVVWLFTDIINGWYALGLVLLSIAISSSVRRSASQFIIEETLENQYYYNMLRDEEINNETLIFQISDNFE